MFYFLPSTANTSMHNNQFQTLIIRVTSPMEAKADPHSPHLSAYHNTLQCLRQRPNPVCVAPEKINTSAKCAIFYSRAVTDHHRRFCHHAQPRLLKKRTRIYLALIKKILFVISITIDRLFASEYARPWNVFVAPLLPRLQPSHGTPRGFYNDFY